VTRASPAPRVTSRRPAATSPALPPYARGKATHLSLLAALRRTVAFDVRLPGAALLDLADSGDDAWVAARDGDLRATLNHLLQHAIRHCPEGTRVDVAVRANHPGATVHVSATPPGTPSDASLDTFEIDAIVARSSARFLDPELALLQAAARRVGARVLLGVPGRTPSGILRDSTVFLSVQFPPPFGGVMGQTA
jgi:hypothetical protein